MQLRKHKEKLEKKKIKDPKDHINIIIMSWGGPDLDKGEVKIDEINKGRSGDESWRKTADTHKMNPEHVKAAGVEASQRPPGHGRAPGEVLHQRRRLPFSYTSMTIAGFAISAIIGYTVLYSKKKPEVDAADVAKVAINTENKPNK
ncbi:unnamed protein product [Amaranthus hypochondriacus]